MKISVCLAAYNGEKFVQQQLESVLHQLSAEDEILVGDDCSTDNTIDVLRSLADQRIRIIQRRKNVGYIRNFELLIEQATGDIIFLSDQDDIWPEGRLTTMIAALTNSPKLAFVGNYDCFSHDKRIEHQKPPRVLQARYSDEPLFNLVRMFLGRIPYYGCCMAFKREFVKSYLPFPGGIGHDHWLAIVGNLHNTLVHSSEVVTFRRIHNGNLTTSARPLWRKVVTRLRWSLCIVQYIYRKV